jgi:TPR repeat protein
LRGGFGCEKNLERAKENSLRASELGHVSAMVWLGDMLDKSNPQRWQWWGRAAAHGASSWFLPDFAKQVELFNSGSGSAAVVLIIGHALQGHVNEEARTIFNRSWGFDSRIVRAKQAIAFYEAQIQATKDAMRAWTLVGIKLKIVKDLRKLVAKLVWNSREEASYDVSEEHEQEEQEENEEQEEQDLRPSARALRVQKKARK